MKKRGKRPESFNIRALAVSTEFEILEKLPKKPWSGRRRKFD